MSRRIPRYPSKPHKSGQARIWLAGRHVYLGVFNSPESHVKYARLVAEYRENGRAPESSQRVDRRTVTIDELVNEFRIWASARYVKNGVHTSELDLFRTALSPVLDLYREIDVNSFGPLALIACRKELVARGYCRLKVNSHLGRIRRVWKWGVSRELVNESTWTALRSVEGLRKGEAHDLPPVRSVPMDRVNALEGHVLPPVWAMIQLQLWSGMRPGEVVRIRTCDVRVEDPAIPPMLTGKVWVYRPESHKTEHHDKTRIIFLGGGAQEVLEPWLRPDDPEAFLFSPAEAVEFKQAQRRAARKTPGQSKYVRKSKSKRKPRLAYTVNAYGHAITHGCETALQMPAEYRIPRQDCKPMERRLSAEEIERRLELARKWRAKHAWAPNQLRHNAATLIRQRYGVEVARVILGHSNLSVTELYAEIDLEKAAKAMAESG